jgi:UDPglucose 6-dehydrogenase
VDSLTLCGTKESALKQADALIIVTEWQNFRAPDFDMIKAQLKNPLIFDGRNLFDPKAMKNKELTYYSVGRA